MLLSAGVQEIIDRAADIERAVELARARIELLAEVGRLGSREQASSSYEGLFPNLYDWIYVVGVAEDGALSFETVNPPLHAREEFLNPDFVGRSPEACLPPENASLMRSHLERVLAEGCPLQFEEEQPVAGKIRSFQTTLTPVRNKWGRIHRIAGISRDTTLLKEAQAALGASEERLALALEGTQQGLWDWDVVNGVMYRSPRWFEMLGLAAAGVEPTIAGGLARTHPDDRDGVERAMRLHLDGHSPRFQAEYRILTGTDEWLWLFDAGKVVSWTADGRPARVAGLCTDITERRRAEESLRALIGGVVHEMRNPAFGIGVNIDALEATFGSQPQTRPFVVGSAGELQPDPEPDERPPRLRRAADDAAGAVPRSRSRRRSSAVVRRAGRGTPCRVRIDFEDDSLILPVHAFRIQQAFRNLIENALFHAPPQSEVVVSTRLRHRDRGNRRPSFTVEDRGPGLMPNA